MRLPSKKCGKSEEDYADTKEQVTVRRHGGNDENRMKRYSNEMSIRR